MPITRSQSGLPPSDNYIPPPHPKRVAIVGSGLAGLTTAHILAKQPEKFEVVVFESVSSLPHNHAPSANNVAKNRTISLDAVSVADDLGAAEKRDNVIDVPMRAFAGGYYANLIKMLTYLDIPFRQQRFLFSFSNFFGTYFVHASNNHRSPPPKPRILTQQQWLLNLAYLFFANMVWFIVVSFYMPHPGETFDHYLTRTPISRAKRFQNDYLIPLMCSVCTCTHEQMRQFPASDVVNYKLLSHKQPHYVVNKGIRTVSERLSANLTVSLNCRVVDVVSPPGFINLRWEKTHVDGRVERCKEDFDHVVLAVNPAIAASVFPPCRKDLSQVPFNFVDTHVSFDRNRSRIYASCADFKASESEGTQLINFDTHDGYTLSTHVHPGGAMVQTAVADMPYHPGRLAEWQRNVQSRFPRVLRTVKSQSIVNDIFRCGPVYPPDSGFATKWRNGELGVWLVGGWCWDGMVLLEGCILSAERTARQLGATIPWDAPVPLPAGRRTRRT